MDHWILSIVSHVIITVSDVALIHKTVSHAVIQIPTCQMGSVSAMKDSTIKDSEIFSVNPVTTTVVSVWILQRNVPPVTQRTLIS